MDIKKPLVSISCLTYNHAKYVCNTIEGFLMQKTNFDFEILIHDDASTDGTTEIIKEYEKKYPNIIKPLYEKENQWVKGRRGSVVFNFPRAQGKYIAMCEGDDQWTDPYKLQKQVDFLEQHPEYILCGTDVTRVETATGQIQPSLNKTFGDITLDDILYRNQITTCTALFKKIDFETQLIPNFDRFTVGDWPLWCSLLRYGKAYNMKEITAQYNIHQGGMVSGRSLTNTLYSKLHDRILLCDDFPDKKNIIKKHGNRILLHYIKNALLLKKTYINSLWQQKSLILKYISK